jgi:hypothetical protein
MITEYTVNRNNILLTLENSVFVIRRDFRDKRDFKDIINNKKRFKNKIFKCNEYNDLSKKLI